MAIPASFLQELLSRVDVVEVVGQYVQLKKGGANFMGLCPFHGEKSPSFSVSPTKQFFHCFGCGKSGDAIGFLMEHTGMSFIEAVKDLAGRVGMPVPEEPQSPQERARAQAQKAKQDSLGSVLEKAGDAYRQQLRQHPRAIDYLKQRGLSGQIAKRFGLGYAPEGWRSLASVFPQYDDPLLVESGLVIASDEPAGDSNPRAEHQREGGKRYDRFRDRIMFPIRNIKGECIGFGGRVIGDGTPKYLNSPETPVFHKGRELYGLYEAREALHRAGYVLVTEGYMDVVALAQLGFANAVATLGTACTPDHVQKLFRFTDSVVFSFDGDAAGRRAARKALDGALPYATDVRSIKFLFLPAEHDPDSYIREHGAEAFAAQVQQAMPLSRFLIEAASTDCDLSSAEGRARLSSQARPLWQLMPEGALKQQLLAELAQKIGLDLAALQSLWQQQGHSDRPVPPAETRRPRAEVPPDAASAPDGFYAGYSPEPSAAESRSGRFRAPWPRKAAPAWRSTGPRAAPASRADHACRLLLANMGLWETLSGEDHALLCGLSSQHGELFMWLDSVFHEQGPLGLGTLLEEMAERPFADDARRWISGLDMSASAALPAASEEEARQELRHLLDYMQMDRLKDLETQALLQAQSGQDPEALERYRSLQERRAELMARQTRQGSPR